MSPAPPESLLEITLYPPGAQLPEGYEVETVGDGSACVMLYPDHAALHISLPALSRAEQRWTVDHALRRMQALRKFSRVALHGAGVDADSLHTIGLDLHHRTRGQLQVSNTSPMQQRIEHVGGFERQFRAWVNEDPEARTSLAIARDIERWGAEWASAAVGGTASADAAAGSAPGQVEVEVLDEPTLRERGLNLLLAVGGGGTISPPRLVLSRYTPAGTDPSARPHLMLVGKGVTFDTGGINVKPYEAFVSTMKNDMAGAALAFWLYRALVESHYPAPLALAIPTCENPVGSNAMKPGALVKSYRGHTVRIDHTDAEGRLILADALAYASEHINPERVLCFATLTTAALIAYGPYATPVHFADPALRARLEAASQRTGEDLHFFPERIWHLEANRDREADLRNTARLPENAVRAAGSRNAAHFLRHFTDLPLCHFDIFGSTWNWAGDAPGAGYGATGAPLRTLLRAFGIGVPTGESLPGAVRLDPEGTAAEGAKPE